ncbi:MAG: hypothetical protein CVU00_00650 [Bacteroidetes bacterium HGW-Bacteroidetes-17]|nr:MAG: hypothetical protein CVU00_00650 [Bacteroidetes bacterium HGW-Bacteroidetes-17]
MKRKYFNITLVLTALIFISSCTKDWEEMNTDPNNPTDGPMTNLLANAIATTGLSFYDSWNQMNSSLSYAGHITKIAYIDEARYNFRPGVLETDFRNYYYIQQDLLKVIGKAQATENKYAEAAALTLSVYNWQQAVDKWGDIPYSEALTAETEANLTPAYDDAAAIYADLLTKLEYANTLFNSPPSALNVLGAGDFLYGNDADKWQKFCNALHLRLAIRTQNVAELNKVLAAPATYPLFNDNSEEAKLHWPGVAPYKEPWANDNDGRDDHGMAKTFIDMMLALADPRLPVYAEKTSAGIYNGAPEGAPNNAFNVNDISRIGTKYRNDYAGYSYFLRFSEQEFIKAEAYLLAGNASAAKAAYESGVAASFEETGMTSSLAAYMTKAEVAWDNNTVYNNKTKIWLQKWIALFKQGQELWAENRRTDFPVMPAAIGSVFSGHNRQPFREPYPNNEFTLNGASIAPAAAGIVDYYWGKQLFWDKRTGVN